eukprot:TRINITY_DN7040_c0_g1_i3.p3 TRINITY_DN7040_c0_g1~~TRINITY_DN7040_c0_g1_i3.p3  ORF type:complete len:189 (-),score=37.24 TRINITY_DN7040_c0_g1_i3:448-1014(-)
MALAVEPVGVVDPLSEGGAGAVEAHKGDMRPLLAVGQGLATALGDAENAFALVAGSLVGFIVECTAVLSVEAGGGTPLGLLAVGRNPQRGGPMDDARGEDGVRGVSMARRNATIGGNVVGGDDGGVVDEKLDGLVGSGAGERGDKGAVQLASIGALVEGFDAVGECGGADGEPPSGDVLVSEVSEVTR